MLVDLISLISFAALFLYLLFGGADYGAGILELFRTHNVVEEQEEIITDAIGPVWEANHIWLILIVVILFCGFPQLYVTLTTSLHVPLVALLLGIVVRGVAFTYRHYDEFKGKPDKLYSWLFALSSLWTSVWLGIIVGACVLGKIDLVSADPYARYVEPWFNSFCLTMGIFLAALFAFLASTFLISEAETARMKKFFHRRALATNLAVLQSGAFLFIAAEWNDKSLASDLLERPASLLMLGLATALGWLIWPLRRLKNQIWSRMLAASVVLCAVLGFYFIHSPALIVTTDSYLNFRNTAAPDATLRQLLIALAIGLFMILPSLFLLFWIFKFKSEKVPKDH